MQHAASFYVPADGVPARLDLKDGASLDGAVELDDVLGEETLFAFFCDSAAPKDALIAAVRAAQKNGEPAFSGCSVDPFPLDKVRR